MKNIDNEILLYLYNLTKGTGNQKFPSSIPKYAKYFEKEIYEIKLILKNLSQDGLLTERCLTQIELTKEGRLHAKEYEQKKERDQTGFFRINVQYLKKFWQDNRDKTFFYIIILFWSLFIYFLRELVSLIF